ncbi:MAG: hypothetical protein KBA30_07035, partial [Clostridia bacterium]|nr:hypothetical protein [Clostridia bacterium]
SATAGAAVLLGERMRLHPDSTMTYQPVGAGYLEAFDSDPAGYTARLGDFLRRYADRDSKQG